MKVGELIEILLQHNEEAVVVMDTGFGGEPLNSAYPTVDGQVTILSNEKIN